MKQSRILIIPILFLAAACSDGTNPGGNNANSGTVSFTYTVGGGDTYDGTGVLTASSATARHASTWSAGWIVSANSSIALFSNEAIGGALANKAVITINRQTAGTGNINTSCTPSTTTACNVVTFIIAGDVTGDDFDYSCTMTSGMITISEISETRVSGSFSGFGTCVQGVTNATTGTAVTNGSFSVPFLSGVPGVGANY